METENDEEITVYPVEGPSGAEYEVLSQDEVNFYEDIKQKYLSDNHFVNVSDMQDLDRVLVMELMVFRWNKWLSLERDFWGGRVDTDELRKSVKAYSIEIRQIKKALGMDKISREKDKGSDLATYIENLGRRAKEFGIHREDQLTKALVLFNELSALLTLNQNTDKIEQKELHCTQDDVFDWLRTVCIPEYEEIDKYFRNHHQRAWIRDL